MAQISPPQYESLDGWQPPDVKELDDTGLSLGFLSDLALKFLYFRGQLSGYEVADLLMLPFETAVRPAMDFLRREQMTEVKGSSGLGAGTFIHAITDKGSIRARGQLERSNYLGPAPITWEQYTEAISAQGTRRLRVSQSTMADALSHLVLEPDVFEKIGPAVNSGKSIFLYGPPGNGKTTIGESIGRMVLGNAMYIPFAIEVDGQIITVYDQINHEAIEEEPSMAGGPGGRSKAIRDRRWIRIKRPAIMVGGELTLDGLDLKYDLNNKYYEAPFQMKANGGMLLIDDFGRQQVRPRDLLNRWIVPMEKNVDFLALRTGRKLEVPFAVLLVFATNLPPGDLVDEAFLRRIRHKIEITSPGFESYREIFRRLCVSRNIPEDERALRYLLQEHYVKKNRKLRANHPRDLLDQIMDIGAYKGIEPTLSKELIDQAAGAYFVDL